MKKSEFFPSPKIRSFDGAKFKNKMATIELRHMSDKKDDQYVHIDGPIFKEYGLFCSGWCGKVLGKSGQKIRMKIKDVCLIEHENGGRNDEKEYRSYNKFFNPDRKDKVIASWTGGFSYRLSNAGDPDQADLKVRFDDFYVESYSHEFKAPEEWYSEIHQDRSAFRFADGFYKSADEAIRVFGNKKEDDLFGERYFPVIVFPKSVSLSVARDIACGAKGCSKPIVTKSHIIFGTRCKPYEYAGIIKDTYEAGGEVPVGVQWDWE